MTNIQSENLEQKENLIKILKETLELQKYLIETLTYQNKFLQDEMKLNDQKLKGIQYAEEDHQNLIIAYKKLEKEKDEKRKEEISETYTLEERNKKIVIDKINKQIESLNLDNKTYYHIVVKATYP